MIHLDGQNAERIIFLSLVFIAQILRTALAIESLHYNKQDAIIQRQSLEAKMEGAKQLIGGILWTGGCLKDVTSPPQVPLFSLYLVRIRFECLKILSYTKCFNKKTLRDKLN